jgi:hypothetical protein
VTHRADLELALRDLLATIRTDAQVRPTHVTIGSPYTDQGRGEPIDLYELQHAELLQLFRRAHAARTGAVTGEVGDIDHVREAAERLAYLGEFREKLPCAGTTNPAVTAEMISQIIRLLDNIAPVAEHALTTTSAELRAGRVRPRATLDELAARRAPSETAGVLEAAATAVRRMIADRVLPALGEAEEQVQRLGRTAHLAWSTCPATAPRWPTTSSSSTTAWGYTAPAATTSGSSAPPAATRSWWSGTWPTTDPSPSSTAANGCCRTSRRGCSMTFPATPRIGCSSTRSNGTPPPARGAMTTRCPP